MLKPTLTMKKSGKLDALLKAAVGSLRPGPDSVKVGFPAGKVDADLVMRAVYNEFGTRGSGKPFKTARGGGFGGPVPERPFMRNTMRANRGKYQKAMAVAARQILEAALDGRDVAGAKREALRGLGVMVQSDIQTEITTLKSPPNSPLTQKLKNSSNPLIDTGEMRARVTYLIEE